MSTVKKPPVQPQPSKSQPDPSKTQLMPIPKRIAEEGSSHEDQIRPLAYRKWQEAGSPVSDGVEFWIAAEIEILQRKKPR